MRVVVLGGTGFLGTHVCAAFANAGHHVLPLSTTGAVRVDLADALGAARLTRTLTELRAEVIRFIEESRAIQVRAVTEAIERHPGKSRLPPAVVAVIATSVGLSLNREEQLGVRSGHAETLAILNAFIEQLEA